MGVHERFHESVAYAGVKAPICAFNCIYADTLCKSMWVWYGLVQVNAAVHSVAKSSNWITSRWALKNERYHLLCVCVPPSFAVFDILLC